MNAVMEMIQDRIEDLGYKGASQTLEEHFRLTEEDHEAAALEFVNARARNAAMRLDGLERAARGVTEIY